MQSYVKVLMITGIQQKKAWFPSYNESMTENCGLLNTGKPKLSWSNPTVYDARALILVPGMEYSNN